MGNDLWDKYDLKNVKLVAHPGVFVPKRYMGLDVGAPFSKQDCIDHGLQVIDGSRPVKITELIVAKHRNGPTGRVTLFFKEDCTKFISLSRRKTLP